MSKKNVVKEVEKKEILRFDPKTESALIKEIAKVYVPTSEITEEQAVVMDTLYVMDADAKTIILGKTEQAKRVLSRFFNSEQYHGGSLVAKLDWTPDQLVGKSKVAIDLMLSMVKIASLTTDAVELTVKLNYPVKIETEHFLAVIAPRVED